jgi:hypothetical protein
LEKNKGGNKWFCEKHKKYASKENAEAVGNRICANFKRGCISELDKNYCHKRCEKCLTEGRENDNKIQKKKHLIAEETKNDDKPFCSGCSKYCDKEDFANDFGKVFKRCDSCRQKDYENDKRGKRDRNYKKELDNNPERKIKRDARIKQQKIDSPELSKEYSMRSRAKK